LCAGEDVERPGVADHAVLHALLESRSQIIENDSATELRAVRRSAGKDFR
jgi:hypothetical protein